MKTLFILKKEDDTIKTIIDQISQLSEVDVINLQDSRDYDALIDQIEQCGKVITW